MTDADKFIGKAIYLVNEIHVSSWSPGDATKGDPVTEVHVILDVQGIPRPIVMRIKSKERADWLIEALIEHRNYVWPDEGGKPQIMTREVLRKWIEVGAWNSPIRVTDVFESAQNYFYVSLDRVLSPNEAVALSAFNLDVTPSPPLSNRYRVIYRPPKDDEA